MDSDKDMSYKYQPIRKEINCLKTITQDGFYVPWYHAHDTYEIVLVVSGNLQIVNNGECVNTNFPALIIHKPYSVHVMHADAERVYERYIISFKADHLADFLKDFPPLDALFQSNLSVFRLSEDRLERFRWIAEHFTSDRRDPRRCKYWLGLFLCEVVEIQGEEISIATGSVPMYIQEVMSYIEKNFNKELRTAEIAKQFYVSQAKLNADFRKYTATTLHTFLVGVRLRKAQKFLEQNNSVVSTAIACGFKNECHFIRCFKENFGVTPYQYALRYRR